MSNETVLTDEQIVAILDAHRPEDGGDSMELAITVSRAIEKAVLQSQDREDSGKLQEAARDMFVRASEIEVLYGTNKETEGLVMAAMRLAYLVGPTEQAIDHARRIEGEK